MMRFSKWLLGAAAMIGIPATQAEVPELLELVPEAKGYELVAKFNPLAWHKDGYEIDNTISYKGDVKRIGYLVKLTGKDGKISWVFASMAPFSKEIADLGVPFPGGKIYQTYVNDLEVASNSPSVKTGKFKKGNIEIWGNNYGGNNSKQIPGATSSLDFGDSPSSNGNYGSFQVHNYLEKETVFAFNRFTALANCDLGIGNNPKGQKDWTFSASGNGYRDAAIYVVAKIDNLSKEKVVSINEKKASLNGTVTPQKVSFAPGEEMTFSLELVNKGEAPTMDYFIRWERTGDDGRKMTGTSNVKEGPAIIKTSMDKPGFVRIYATVADQYGRVLSERKVFFDGGAGVQIDQLEGLPEPADFDAFWNKQKAELAKVPMKVKMDKLPISTPKLDVYAVSVSCAGARPVTGYLTVPAGAKDKSLPAQVNYQGYSIAVQKQPSANGPLDKINFTINAHGYDLGKDSAYYKDFFQKIRTPKYRYAFDPEQNSNPENAYFKQMAFRVMRSLEFVKSLPQWNGKTLTVNGGSQGGLQSIWAAALDSDVTFANVHVPWCCNIGGNKIQKRLRSGFQPAYVPGLDYFDTANHAKRVKCRTSIYAGLGDYVCPPSGVAVMYNNLKCPKTIIWNQGETHGFRRQQRQQMKLEAK